MVFSNQSGEKFEFLDGGELVGDLHERSERKVRDLFTSGLVELYKLEIVELPPRDAVVKVFHRVPGTVPEAHADDRKSIPRSFTDCLSPVCYFFFFFMFVDLFFVLYCSIVVQLWFNFFFSFFFSKMNTFDLGL